MAALDDLASKLFGSKRAESNIVSTDATTRTYVGTATSASEDGSVYVALSQDVTLPDDDDGEHGLGVEMPTTVAVDEGDEVLVTLMGGGTMKSPVVTGNPGWGDRMQAQVDSAETLAQQAEDVAQEAAAEVEQVRQDVADFRDDVATTYATKVERQDGDDAVKTWVTTNYTNSNDLATTYATKTLVSQTKDAIELAASQTYETQTDAAATYATKSALTVGLNGIRTEVAEDYQPKGDYATTASMNSAIQQSASSIESSVAATYTTKAEFEGLQVGGTNLLHDTEDWANWACTAQVTVSDGVLTAVNTATVAFRKANGWFVPAKADILNEQIVVSFDAKKSASTALSTMCVQLFETDKPYKSVVSGNITEGKRYYTVLNNAVWHDTAKINDSTWTRVYSDPIVLADVLTGSYPEYAYLAFYIGITNQIGSASYRNVMVERGTIATDWSPAPEDMATTYATKTEVQQTAAGLDTRITTAQSTADGAYLERTTTGTTIDTTGAATIRSLVVEGQSVQDGTPTPSAPVPIVSVEPRNLLPAYSATTVNGITFTVDGSGAVTANGTASATVNHYVLFTVPETGAYAMSGCPAGGSASTYQLWTYDTTTPRDQQLTDTGSGATGTFTKGHIISVRIRFQSGYTATNLTFRPMLERGTTANPYQPYGCVTLVAQSRNLLDPLTLGAYAGGSISKNSKVTYSGDTVTATNMIANSQLVGYSIKASAFRETTLTVTATSAISTCVCYWQWWNGTTEVGGQNSTPVSIRGSKAEKTFSITIPDNVTHMFFGIGTLSGGTYTMSNVQLELGSTATEYVPYEGTTYPIDLQGHALRSLPDGTHDEMAVDSLGRVTMTQRVGVTTTATTDGITATVGTDAMSTTGDLSDGATVLYKLATPQTIDLGTIDLPAPADTLWLDAAIAPTMGATWWTVDGIAGQQALDAEVTERQTLIRQFSGGVLAGYVGNAIAALVNAAGSFDVVRTAWSGGVPSILGTLATFGANLIRIGEETGQNVLITSTGQFFRDGLNNLLALVAGTARSETFTVNSYVYDPTYSYMATHTIGVEHIAIQSVTFDGSEFPKFSATTRRGWVYKKSTNLLSLRFHQSDSALGKQVTVNYRTFASMVIYDGTGNDAENIAASFSADDIMLGGSIDGDVDDDKASIRFFGGSVDTETTYIDASGGISTSSITGDPCYLNREIMLGNIVTDSRLYDDSGRRANGFVSFSQSISDSYNTGGETTSSYVNSYVSMYSGTNNVANYAAITATSVDNLIDSSTSDTETYTEVSARADRLRLEDTSGEAIIPMEQAIAALQQPYAMFTGSSGTATSTANGWRITWFNTVYSHSPNWSDYFSFSNGVITAKHNIQLEISGCMNWTDSVAGNRGFGVFVNSSTVGSGTEYSEFQMFPNTVNSRKSVWMAGLVLSLDANVKCAVGRYENNGAVYVNGANFSRIELKVLGTF